MKRKAKGEAQPETSTPDTAAVPDKPDPYLIEISRRPDESERNAVGRNALRPTMGAAMAIKEYASRYGESLEVMALITALSDQGKAVIGGKLDRAELMLTVQAHTLDVIFNTLARKAAINMGEYLDTAELYLRLALKAQSQCRSTLETLALMKNPAPIAFVRQANIAHGPQQVNNGPAPAGDPSRARETENQSNGLSGSANELLSDSRAPALSSRANPQVEPVGAVTEDSSGKGASKPEC